MNYDEIYEMIAKKYGITPQEVRNEILIALQAGWMNENNSVEVKEHQEEISPQGEIPTPEAVIGYMTDKIRKTK